MRYCVALEQIWLIAKEPQEPAPASGTGSWQHGGQGRSLPSQGPGPAPSKASRAGPGVAAKASPVPRSPGKPVVTRQVRGQAAKAVSQSVPGEGNWGQTQPRDSPAGRHSAGVGQDLWGPRPGPGPVAPATQREL